MLRFGMVGGGNGGQIGAAHYRAASLDGQLLLSAGCFSRDWEKNVQQGQVWGVDQQRIYADAFEMAEREAARGDGIDFVVIATPNESHYAIARSFLEKGIHVFCEKPLTNVSEQACELTALAQRTGTLLAVNYTYSGYPMIRQARAMVGSGALGRIFKVVSEYRQDGQIIRAANFKPWHFDPQIAGASACTANIGTHIEYLVACMTGLRIESIAAIFDSVPKGRPIETDFSAMVRYAGGATGTMWGCKTAIGEDCNINIRIMGEKGSLEWSHLQPQLLKVALLDQPVQIYAAGRDYLDIRARSMTRLSNGQVEGYHDAFANIYREWVRHIKDHKQGISQPPYWYPTGEDGANGVRFVQACVKSHRQNGAWVRLENLTC